MSFQSKVGIWLVKCFGPAVAADTTERNHRFLEEALELVQSTGCTQSEAHQLVDYVYGRPVGDVLQEIGGTMVTLAALCEANKFDMKACGRVELSRIKGKTEEIRAKQAAKPKHSPLPQLPASAAYKYDAETLAQKESNALLKKAILDAAQDISIVHNAGCHSSPENYLRILESIVSMAKNSCAYEKSASEWRDSSSVLRKALHDAALASNLTFPNTLYTDQQLVSFCKQLGTKNKELQDAYAAKQLAEDRLADLSVAVAALLKSRLPDFEVGNVKTLVRGCEELQLYLGEVPTNSLLHMIKNYATELRLFQGKDNYSSMEAVHRIKSFTDSLVDQNSNNEAYAQLYVNLRDETTRLLAEADITVECCDPAVLVKACASLKDLVHSWKTAGTIETAKCDAQFVYSAVAARIDSKAQVLMSFTDRDACDAFVNDCRVDERRLKEFRGSAKAAQEFRSSLKMTQYIGHDYYVTRQSVLDEKKQLSPLSVMFDVEQFLKNNAHRGQHVSYYHNLSQKYAIDIGQAGGTFYYVLPNGVWSEVPARCRSLNSVLLPQDIDGIPVRRLVYLQDPQSASINVIDFDVSSTTSPTDDVVTFYHGLSDIHNIKVLDGNFMAVLEDGTEVENFKSVGLFINTIAFHPYFNGKKILGLKFRVFKKQSRSMNGAGHANRP